MTDSYSNNSKQIDDDLLSQPWTSHNTDGMQIEKERNRFSCYDTIDPKWLAGALEVEDHRIYVHQEILEWIVKCINKNILNEKVRATVHEELYHHNLNGPIHLISFYQHKFIQLKIRRTIPKFIILVKEMLKYKMPWKMRPTYFLRMDSDFENQKVQLMNELQLVNLHDLFKSITEHVNWMYIPKIEIYEFPEYLTEDQRNKIDRIFRNLSKSKPSIYICDQFEWHKALLNFVDVDKVAMDICVEEWCRYDLLNDFGVDDILNLDLANKDYRDPYYNSYLDRHLDNLLKKKLPERIDFPVYRFEPYVGRYFVSRFYDKISTLSDVCTDNDDLVMLYDIPKMLYTVNKVNLEGNQPDPKDLLKMEYPDSVFSISNYTHFSDSLFRALLNKQFGSPTFSIKFDKEFNFIYGSDPVSQHLTNDCNWTFGTKTITIKLENCNENNAEKLANFVKYVINLFKENHKLNVEVTIWFVNCILCDYTFLENIGNCFQCLRFEHTNLSYQHLKVLRCATQHNWIEFVDCDGITDSNIETLLKYIDVDRISIFGTNACTPILYYLAAEYLMRKEGVDTVIVDRFAENIDIQNIHFDFGLVEFFKDGDKINIRNRSSRERVDLYCLINDVLEDESFDSTNNVYIE